MANEDPLVAMDSVNNDQSVNYNMMGYRTMMYGNQNQFGFSPRQGFAQRTGNAAGQQQAVANGGGGGGADGGNVQLAQSGNSLEYDYTDAATRRLAGGIGVSGYGYGGSGLGGGNAAGYGGYGGGIGAGAGVGAGVYDRSGSGYGGGGGYGGYTPINVLGSQYAQCADEGLNPALVLATLVGSAVAFAVLYRQVTVGRRKRRNFGDSNDWMNDIYAGVADMMWKGKLSYCH